MNTRVVSIICLVWAVVFIGSCGDTDGYDSDANSTGDVSGDSNGCAEYEVGYRGIEIRSANGWAPIIKGNGYAQLGETGTTTRTDGASAFRLSFEGGEAFDVRIDKQMTGDLPLVFGEDVYAFLVVEDVAWINVQLVIWSMDGKILLYLEDMGESYSDEWGKKDELGLKYPVFEMGEKVCEEVDLCGHAAHYSIKVAWPDEGEISAFSPGEIAYVEHGVDRYRVFVGASVEYNWRECTDSPGHWMSVGVSLTERTR